MSYLLEMIAGLDFCCKYRPTHGLLMRSLMVYYSHWLMNTTRRRQARSTQQGRTPTLLIAIAMLNEKIDHGMFTAQVISSISSNTSGTFGGDFFVIVSNIV